MLETLNHQANINLNSNGGGLRFSGDGADNNQMILSPDGYLGIGTTSPSSSLHVAGAIDSTPSGAGIHMGLLSNQATIALVPLHAASTGDITFCPNNSSNVGRIRYNFDDNFLQFRVNSVDRMHIDSAGNVGIGTTTPQEKLDVNGSVRLGTWTDTSRYVGITQPTDTIILAGMEIESVDAGTGGASSGNYSQNVHIHTHHKATSHGERLTVQYDGNVGIGTSPSYQLDVSGAITTNDMMTAKSYTANSDETLKENIKILTDPLEKILQLEGKIYNWKKDKEKRQHAGLIAQEVEQHIKEVVIDDHADGKKGIDYNGLIPYLVECIKTQQNQIDTQQKQINTLNDRLAVLENK